MAEALQGKYLIVGLGNPGKTYVKTRHNIGFRILEVFAEQKGLEFHKDKSFKAALAKGKTEHGALYLLKPQTYMNLSGEAVQLCSRFYEIPVENLLIIADDFALSFGELRLRRQGSSGGHNGLKSIEHHLGTQEYPRLKVGIGYPGQKSWPDYVLEEFTPEENKSLPEVIANAVEAMDLWLQQGIDAAMRSVNLKANKSSK